MLRNVPMKLMRRSCPDYPARRGDRPYATLEHSRVAVGPGPCGRTRCALLTRYASGDDTIGFRGFIAVNRTAGPRSFGGAGLWVDQWLGGRDLELTCVCSRTCVSNGPGDPSYPAAERLADVSVWGLLSVRRSRKREQRATICFHSCRWQSLFKIWINRDASSAR